MVLQSMRRSVERGLVLGLFVAGLLGNSSQALALSDADVLEFPIPEVSYEVDLAGEGVTSLSNGETYDFSVTRTDVFNPSGNNPDPTDAATWTVLSYEATVTYLGLDAPGEDFTLVLTSLRQGDFDGSLLPPLIDGGFSLPSLADDEYFYAFDPMLSEHGDPGTIIDDEGAYFLAFRFAAVSGAAYTFHYDVILREPLTGTLNHFNRGYLTTSATAPLPEPSGLMALATGLIGLFVLRRARAQK